MQTVVKQATLADIELQSDSLDAVRAAEIYREHGCLVVRGLMRPYFADFVADVAAAAEQAISLLPQADKAVEGWYTPDGTLFLPAPENFGRAQQIMVLNVTYRNSAAMFRSAIDSRVLDIAEDVLGPDVELFMDGQVLYKEGSGGHPKHLHQDSAYFEHLLDGPMAMLAYAIDTDLRNGALHVVPGSHRLGQLPHVNTFSHLGLDQNEWPWERAIPIEGKAGDAIFFNVRTVHGSKQNQSPKPRPVFIHRYRSAYDHVIVGGTTVENRSQVDRQQRRVEPPGIMVRGRRRHRD